MKLLTIDMPQLKEVRKKIKSDISNYNTLVVFDLDSTLFNVTPRSAQIIKDLLKDNFFVEQFHDYVEQLKSVQFIHGDWGIKDALIRANVIGPLQMFESIRLHWVSNFFSNSYLIYDQPYQGAPYFVNELSDIGATITYLTGRDIPRMQEGTLSSLEQHGFPLVKDFHLIMKPQSGLMDETFKYEKLKDLSKGFDKVWFFENEPVISNYVQKHLPKINVVFIDTVHSKKETPQSPQFTIKGCYQ